MRGKADNPLDWLTFGLRDLQWAKEDLLTGKIDRCPPTLQQACEKLLKAWLLSKGWQLIKTHDVAALISKAMEWSADLAWFLPVAATPTEEYFAERYPGDFDPAPTAQEAAVLLAEVEKLFTRLQPDLNPPNP